MTLSRYGSSKTESTKDSVTLDLQNNLDSVIYCPLTNCIYHEPVIGPDGYTYEKKAIQYYLVNESKINTDGKEMLFKSPITGKSMPGTLIANNTVKSLVALVLSSSPDLQYCQFLTSKPYYLFDAEFKSILCQGKYEDLVMYFRILLNDIIEKKDMTVAQLIFNCKDNELVKHLLSNSEDVNLQGPLEKFPLHDAAIYSNPEIIAFMINELKVKYLIKDILGNLAVHYMCEHQKITPEIYNIVASAETADIKNSEGLCPIHIISKYNNDWKNFAPFIQACNSYHFNIASNEGRYALHYICEFANFDTIRRVIDLDIDLDVECLGDNKDSVAEDFIRLNAKLQREQKRTLILKYLKKRKAIKNKKIFMDQMESYYAVLDELKQKFEIKNIVNEINQLTDVVKVDSESENEGSDSESDTYSESSCDEYETITNFDEDHFDLDNITENSGSEGSEHCNSFNNSRVIEICDSGLTKNLSGIQIYDNYDSGVKKSFQ
jgi:hypothetical protein